ncbi:tripartite tricarboxylate transporter TctB family protein [Brevibacterium renqingii]|uniref:tripartite tricarboxylate transporter TctB family protein n=1 Tax=Brevibacterium renqingii TaxID=2776916 RepID=UPI001ADF20B1
MTPQSIDDQRADVGSRTASAALSSVVLGFLAVFYVINAFLLPDAAVEEGIGPKTFPLVVGIVLLCTTGLGIIAIVRGGVEVRPVGGQEVLRVASCIVLFGLYTASIFLIGFVEASVIFSMLVSMTVFGVRLSAVRAVGLFVINIVIAMALFLIFDVWLHVLLPVGWLEFWVFGGLQL